MTETIEDEDCDQAYHEGYADGQEDANGAATDTFKAVVAWLQKRDMALWADYPEGITATDIINNLNEYENGLLPEAQRSELETGK